MGNKKVTLMSYRASDEDLHALEEINKYIMEKFPGLWPNKTQTLKWAIHRTYEWTQAQKESGK